MTARLRSGVRTRWGSDRGAFTAMVVTLIVMLLVVAGLVVDGGFVLNARAQSYDDVEQAARVGANEIDEAVLRSEGRVVLDTGRAEAEAESYIRTLRTGENYAAVREGYSAVTASATATTVTVRAERVVETRLLSMIGIETIDVAAEATADAQVGIEGPLP